MEAHKGETLCFFQAFSILSEAKDEDERKRLILLDLFENTEGCLKKMDKKFLNLLQMKVPNVIENIKNHKLQLARKEYFLLVAGIYLNFVEII